MKAVKYGASWCAPCHYMRQNLSESGIPFEEIDIDEHPEVLAPKNIRVVPVTEFFDDAGNMIRRVEGVISTEEIRAIAANK